MNLINRFLWYFFKINLSNTGDRNIWYLVLEMFWASILGSIALFNAAYAIRLGADNLQVSLLTSIPALMAVLVSIPAGRFLQRRARRAPWVFGGLFLHRAGYLLVAISPWVEIPTISPGMLVVLVLVLISAPAHFFNVGWIAMLGEVVPENRRAAVFAARNIVNQVTVSITVFLCGQWLSKIAFPINYQSLYMLGFVASMLSMYYLYKMIVPDSKVAEVEPASTGFKSPRQFIGSVNQTMRENPAFMRITRNTLLHGFGVWMAAPLYALYFVRELEATDAWLGLNGMVASVGTIAGYSFWRWLMTRWGEPLSLKRTICLVGVYPLLVGLTPSLSLILVLGAINGLIVPGTNLSHFNMLLKVTPAESRPTHTAMYITIMNIGAFVCPIIAVAVANIIGLGPMLVAAGLLSVIGSTSFIWWPVTKEEPEVLTAAAVP
jgi:MFS family permease